MTAQTSELDLDAIGTVARHRAYGSVARVVGHEVEIRGLVVRVGDVVSVSCPDGARLGEHFTQAVLGCRKR